MHHSRDVSTSRTQFMCDASVREAEATVLDGMMIRMSEAGFNSFVEAIEAPEKVNKTLLTLSHFAPSLRV
jgi:uncharacterized protein (DUF1778 family)